MLIETIRKDMRDAKKSRETLKVNLLSTLYAEIFTQSKSGKEMTEEDELKIIRKFIKNIDETVALDINEDTRNKLTDEKKLLVAYLPQQLSKDEIEKIVSEQVSEGKTIKDIMPFFKENYSGRYDGKTVSEIIKAKTG
ncbi:MAG: GatB/YqeY domain-containing protein [Chlorobi bacterium]|nr:GatB/YqeY domain-containing protein [Chlorobiota bacterium]MCI0717181.1 GatB/YqeY domain-containing protein [Chlorobiota bacterium]